jgi:hypothetical protein
LPLFFVTRPEATAGRGAAVALALAAFLGLATRFGTTRTEPSIPLVTAWKASEVWSAKLTGTGPLVGFISTVVEKNGLTVL